MKRLDHAGIVFDHAAGMLASAIAERHGTTENTISAVLNRLRKEYKFGLQPLPPRQSEPPAGLIAMYVKGAKLVEIAEATGISTKSVSRWITKLVDDGVLMNRNPAAATLAPKHGFSAKELIVDDVHIDAPEAVTRVASAKAKIACQRHLDDLIAEYSSPLAVASLAQMNFARQSAPPPFSQFARDSQGKVLI